MAAGLIVGQAGFAAAATKRRASAAEPSTRSEKGAVVSVEITAAPRGAPNVLFIIADDLNDWVGWMGGHPQARTPNMDRLARMGMRFANAHCNYALCNPSRTSLLTGMLPSSSGVFGNEQDWRRSKQIVGKLTLPEHFRAQGFITAAGGKIFHANHGGPEGRLAGWHGGRRGFECDRAWTERFPARGVQIPDLPVHTGRNFNGLDIWHWDWGGIQVDEEETDDGQVTAWAAEFLKRKHAKPFFLAVGLYRPHSPWYVPDKYFEERPLSEVILPKVKENDLDDVPEFARSHLKRGDNFHQRIVSKDLWQDAVRGYLASISFCDAMLGRVLDAVAVGPNIGKTVVVFTSDHGWYLGEKQMWHKGKLWEEATRVPLSIFAPGVTQADSVSNQPVGLVDLYPTLCDLAGLKKPEHLDGESLVPLLKEPSMARSRPVVTAMGGGANASFAARSDRWRYIRYADGSEELYDHASDPDEWTNLAARPEHEPVKKTLAASFPKEWKSAARLAAEIERAESPDGSVDYKLQPGDELQGGDAPMIEGKGIYLDAAFEFDPAVDGDSTLIAQGGTAAGYVLHFVDRKPTLSVFIGGKQTAATAGEIGAGRITLRAVIGADGTLSLAVPGNSEIAVNAPFRAGFPRQPAQGLVVGQSFGILSAKDFPNSTPFDGVVHRMRLTVFPKQTIAPSAVPAAKPIEELPAASVGDPAAAPVSPKPNPKP